MALTLAQKLRIKAGMKLLTMHAPAGFSRELEPLPAEVEVSARFRVFDQLHWFVQNKAELDKDTKKVIGQLHTGMICWIYFPKGSSRIQTDLSRDKGWESLLHRKDLQWLSLISFNETWSSFGFRMSKAPIAKKRGDGLANPVPSFADPKTKAVELPGDLQSAMTGKKKASDFFASLSYTNRKEYVQWVISAKRAETRSGRISQTVEKLEKGWKNPSNR